VSPVLVLALRRGAPELLTLARRVGSPVAVVPEDADPPRLAALGRYGAQRVCLVHDTDVVAALADLARAERPAAILIPAGRRGNEIAGRLAVRLGSGVVAGAIDVTADAGGPIAVRGAGLRVVRGTPIFTVQTGAIIAEAAPAEPVVADVPGIESPARGVRVVSRAVRSHCASMAAAPVVVAGGHGVGSPEGFSLVARVARALGGEAAGSHTAAELGWCPRRRQVDQVGSVVHPRLYVALGISGSVRHRAGMQRAETIVAINRDPTAPIFQIADFGVVGDLHQVVPAFLMELGRRRRQEWCGDS
jgi:electron transfer flavoprotein alpha subunit